MNRTPEEWTVLPNIITWQNDADPSAKITLLSAIEDIAEQAAHIKELRVAAKPFASMCPHSKVEMVYHVHLYHTPYRYEPDFTGEDLGRLRAALNQKEGV